MKWPNDPSSATRRTGRYDCNPVKGRGPTGLYARALAAEPSSSSVEGDALERIPSEPNSPFTAAIPALIAPRSGSCWYMIRQSTPTAKSEIASGMKTAIFFALLATLTALAA